MKANDKQKIKSYKDLAVWQKAMVLVGEVYKISQTFPQTEVFTLTSQLRRAAISIPSNIAECYGRNMTREYQQFLRIARGSLLEVETCMQIADNLGYLQQQQLTLLLSQTKEINKMLNAIINSLAKSKSQ